jgi:hypothetical protein
MAREQWPEAVARLNEAKALRPNDARVRLGLASARARDGKLADAIRELETLDPRAPNLSAVTAPGAYCIHAQRGAEAVALLAPVVERVPRFAEARFLLGADGPARRCRPSQRPSRARPGVPDARAGGPSHGELRAGAQAERPGRERPEQPGLPEVPQILDTLGWVQDLAQAERLDTRIKELGG